MRFNKSLALIVVLFILLGILVIDGSSILFGKWQLSDAADAAAFDAALEYGKSSSLGRAETAAQALLDERVQGAKLVKITADEDGNVTIVVTKTASTLFLDKVSATEPWGQLRVEATAEPSSL